MVTRAVIWDIDKVWYQDISTTYAARGIRADFRPYLQGFVEERKWFTHDDVTRWEETTGRKIDSVGAVADMLTDFLYKAELRSTVYAGVSDQEAKNRTIEGKQELLRGMTFGEVKAIADSVQNTAGLAEAISDITNAGIHQVGFSDGLAPFVAYKMQDRHVDIGGVVPALVLVYGEPQYFDENSLHLLDRANVELSGKVGPFNKGESIFGHISSNGYGLSEVAAIDDSAANLATLTKIRDGGGVAVGFNVNDEKKFEEAKIPVLKGGDLRPFAEIVIDRRRIREFCKMWGVEV